MKNLKNSPVKGYKVFNPDFTCRDFQFSEGETFEMPLPIEICEQGFHFCLKAGDCFSYYGFDSNNIVCEVEALGEIQYHDDDSKACTNILRIVRKLDWQEVLFVANEGKDNTGYRNTGDRNTGYWNTGNRNTGVFCSGEPPLMVFNKPCNMTLQEFENSAVFQIMRNDVDIKIWVPEHEMTDEEKEKYPSYKTTEGYLKDIPFKEAFQNAWHNWTEAQRGYFFEVPNFDKDIFFEITGIKID